MKSRIQSIDGVLLGVFVCALAVRTAPAGGLDYQIKYVPDFDQKRAAGPMIPGLPNDGACHCMPASSINWVAFLTNRGYPQLGPPGNWQNADRYNIVTAAIDDLGADMLTQPGGPDPNNPKVNLRCGTGGDEAEAALRDNFDALTPGKFVVSQHYAGGNYAPRYTTLVNAMLGGSLVLLRYGHYDEVIIPLQGAPAYLRDGGHIISLTGVQNYNELNVRVRFRNPSTDESPDNLTAQSLFSTEDSSVLNVTAVFANDDEVVERTQTRLLDISTNPKFIDGYIQIRPVFGLTVPDCCGNIQMNALNPIPAVHGSPPMNAMYTSPSGTPILDVEIHPELNRYFMLVAAPPTGGSPALWEIDPLTSAANFIVNLISPTSMTSGRSGRVFVLDGSQVRVIDPDASAPLIDSVNLPVPIGGRIDYDDDSDDVVGISTTTHQLVFVDWDPAGSTVTTKALPTGTATPGLAIACAKGKHPGRVWITSSLGTSAYAIESDAAGALQVVDQINFAPTVLGGSVDALHVDSRENVFLAIGGVIVEYEKNERVWNQPASSDFGGLSSGHHLRLASSRTNFDPAVMSGPRQLDVLPTDHAPAVADCPADIVPVPLGNGVVDIDDLLNVITSWGACSGPNPETCPADIAPAGSGNQAVDIDDLLRVIISWGACP